MVDYGRLYFLKRHKKISPVAHALLAMELTLLPSRDDKRFLDLEQDCDYSRSDAI